MTTLPCSSMSNTGRCEANARRLRFVTFALFVLVGLTESRLWAQGERAAAKRAVLVGINAYDHVKLAPLQFAENDARDMADVLKGLGYTVELVVGEKATKATVEAALTRVIDDCKKGDTVLVGLAGHGLQFRGQKDCYFVPVDGRPFENKRDSLVSLSGVYTQLDESFAGIKVLLVDACRDDPTSARGIDADTAPRPPQGVAALFSCKAGERAFEHKSLSHGVFFHHVLEGLKGRAKDEEGEVTFAGLAAYVTKNVSRTVPNLIDGAKQSPNMKADYSAEPVLAKLELKPVTPPTVPTPTPSFSTPLFPAPSIPTPTVPAPNPVTPGKAGPNANVGIFLVGDNVIVQLRTGGTARGRVTEYSVEFSKYRVEYSEPIFNPEPSVTPPPPKKVFGFFSASELSKSK